MQHAIDANRFLNFGETDLDKDACALIFSALDQDSCMRFNATPLIGYDFTETVAAGVERRYNDFEKMASHLLLPHELQVYKAIFLTSAFDDVLGEVVSPVETIGAGLRQSTQRVMADYRQTVKSFVYRMAMHAGIKQDETVLDDVVTDFRARHAQALLSGKSGSAAEDLKQYCLKATRDLGDRDIFLCGNDADWAGSAVMRKNSLMNGYYGQIKGKTTFAGLQASIHERCDNARFMVRVSDRKTQKGEMPTLHYWPGHMHYNLIESYENDLNQLYIMAAGDPKLQQLALLTVNHCYTTSIQLFDWAKPFVSPDKMPNEPGLLCSEKSHEDFNMGMVRAHGKNGLPDGVVDRGAVAGDYAHNLETMTMKGQIELPAPGTSLARTPVDKRLVVALN